MQQSAYYTEWKQFSKYNFTDTTLSANQDWESEEMSF